jgi:murein DD-endopeptidase MepM/ murein hydrolase activator NlpD
MQNLKEFICKISIATILSASILNSTLCIRAHAENEWVKVASISTYYISTIESTPVGIIAGEFKATSVTNPPPHNGVFFSPDFGISWEPIGLHGRGILDLKYFNGTIYATTYFTIDNSSGLFLSKDFGKTWENTGPNVSTTKVDRDETTIYLGTKHYGIYTSKDEGLTWEKVWEGSGTSLQIFEIQSSNDVTFASTLSKTYRTTDNGESWSEIRALEGLTINSICINGSTIFAGSTGTGGLYRSTDRGVTWEKVTSFGNYSVDKIIFFEGIYYAGRYNPETKKYSVFSSSDEGNTWSDTGLNLTSIDKVNSLTVLFSMPSYLFSSVTTKGLHKYQIPIKEPSKYPFLSIPWQAQEESELVDTITSYFDHSYPLLGYSYYPEPESERESTWNFLGYKNSEPLIYYSSHGGTDFGLKYGTEILAPASGYASYYYCKDCGNSIKINHGNGYQTTYMHLQDEGLITKSDKIWVNNYDIIGKVGLTGRTTGPHLHFEVTKDRDMDESFTNDFPMGRTDPFGWQIKGITDPWETFTWTDILGEHSGTSSYYLWNNDNRETYKVIKSSTNPEDYILMLDNKIIEFEDQEEFFTAKIIPYIRPIHSNSTNTISYIKKTSFILEAFDQTGNPIKYFNNPIKISINLEANHLQNIVPETIKLHFWNEELKIWQKIQSLLDQQMNKLETEVNHLSWFAVFGEKIDSQPPKTQILLSGNQENSWFKEYPLVELTTENAGDLEFTIYSTDDGDFWHNYHQPFHIEEDGIINLIYKSRDLNGNQEVDNNSAVHINTKGLETERIKIENSGFTMN